MSRIGDDVFVLKVLGTSEEVKVRVEDVAELGFIEKDMCLRKLEDSKVKKDHLEEERGSRSKHSRDEVKERRADGNRGGKEEKGKGEVLDVIGPTTCDVSMDESRGIRDSDTHQMLNVKLEHIAEYIGDPNLLGH
ncbi:hypothetical protein RYX36_021688 [Vicia faba]